MYWENENDMSNHLIGCIFRLKSNKRAVYITDIRIRDNEPRVRLRYVNEADGIATWRNFSVLDPSSPPLGYVNLAGRCAKFVTRRPRRRWRWGVDSHNTNLSFHELGSSRMKSLARTIEGVYPSYEEAIALSDDEEVRVAFTRNFAVEGGSFYYQDLYVGNITPVGLIEFRQKYTFLSKLPEVSEYVN